MALLKLPTPHIRLNPRSGYFRTDWYIRWMCGLVGAKLNIGFGRTPSEAYCEWNKRYGRHETLPLDFQPRPRSFNSDDRL